MDCWVVDQCIHSCGLVGAQRVRHRNRIVRSEITLQIRQCLPCESTTPCYIDDQLQQHSHCLILLLVVSPLLLVGRVQIIQLRKGKFGGCIPSKSSVNRLLLHQFWGTTNSRLVAGVRTRTKPFPLVQARILKKNQRISPGFVSHHSNLLRQSDLHFFERFWSLSVTRWFVSSCRPKDMLEVVSSKRSRTSSRKSFHNSSFMLLGLWVDSRARNATCWPETLVCCFGASGGSRMWDPWGSLAFQDDHQNEAG